MSDPTSSQKIRLAALRIVAPSMLDRGYDAKHIVSEADIVARFARDGEVPVEDNPGTPPK